MIKNKLRPDAKVAIVIPTPSIKDDAVGYLLNDYPGTKLLQRLGGVGILRNNISILSVVRERHTRIEKISHDELLCWEELLKRDLAKINPNLIIAVGEIPLNLLTGMESHTKYRGSILQCRHSDAKVISFFDLAYCHTLNEWEPLTQWDAEKAARHMHDKDLRRKDLQIHITSDLELLRHEFLNEDYLNDPSSVLSFDIEACGNVMTCIGFSKDPNVAYTIPLVHLPTPERKDALALISMILGSEVKKIAQNGNFDIFFLAHYYRIKVANFWWDTMLAQHSMFSNLPKGLDTLNSIYTNEPYWKDEGKQWKMQMKFNAKQWHDFFEYNAKDVANTLEIAIAQKDLLDKRDTWDTFHQEMDLCYPLINMELTGCKVDLTKKEELRENNDAVIAKLELFLSSLVGGYLNIGSTPQMQHYLYDLCKMPKRTYKGKVTCDEDALKSLTFKCPPLLKCILALRDHKTRNRFLNMKVDSDGRVRSTFKPGGTETGRLSSSKSIVGTGFNLQTIPKQFRAFFVPDPDHVLIQVDYSKAESWIVAHLARDEKMLEALNGPDFHSTNATNFLGHPVTKADYDDRQLGKKISHGANYRMTDFLLWKDLLSEGFNYSRNEVNDLLEAYHSAYPNIRKVFHKYVEDCLNRDRTIPNAFGRKITYYGHYSDHMLNSATAFYPQGTVGDLTNKALLNVWNRLRSKGVQLLLQVHDSLVMQVQKSKIGQTMIDEIADCMAVPITIHGNTFTIPIDVEVSETDWYHLVDWKKYKKWRQLDMAA